MEEEKRIVDAQESRHVESEATCIRGGLRNRRCTSGASIVRAVVNKHLLHAERLGRPSANMPETGNGPAGSRFGLW